MSEPRTFTEDFKRFFLRGLVVLLPSILTLWILVKAYQFVDDTIAEPINRNIRAVMVRGADGWEPLRSAFDPSDEAIAARLAEIGAGSASAPLPSTGAIRQELRAASIQQWWNSHWYMDVIGLLVAVITVYIAGRLLGGFVGRRVYRRLERVITTVPVFRHVYPHVKQIVDFMFADEQPLKFNRVVLCEYPRKGLWSIGFMTGGSMRSIREKVGDAVSVFIPSSPTPFTGYTVTVPEKDLIEIPISVDEAIRFTVSAGVLVPPKETPESVLEHARNTGLIPIGSTSNDDIDPNDLDDPDNSAAADVPLRPSAPPPSAGPSRGDSETAA